MEEREEPGRFWWVMVAILKVAAAMSRGGRIDPSLSKTYYAPPVTALS
jgi:hypothetical protein